MIDYNFIPETLEWCRKHYVPPIEKHISCKYFGNCDGMNGSYHWCLEMTPYQWEMCSDETRVKIFFVLSRVTQQRHEKRQRSLLSDASKIIDI